MSCKLTKITSYLIKNCLIGLLTKYIRVFFGYYIQAILNKLTNCLIGFFKTSGWEQEKVNFHEV